MIKKNNIGTCLLALQSNYQLIKSQSPILIPWATRSLTKCLRKEVGLQTKLENIRFVELVICSQKQINQAWGTVLP